ncbi:unnamed protein product [Fraxinus pennsylvanica]|uniref:Uncharacterized protein n=1 Tax=Fraxinus pennsylvanica TaxID=56036 RepID=A0AAD2DX94_9LAMI|nr:unnamed protein product [Fraxinus pennsylvanica]
MLLIWKNVGQIGEEVGKMGVDGNTEIMVAHKGKVENEEKLVKMKSRSMEERSFYFSRVLLKIGLNPIMVTGDNWRTAQAFAKEVGIIDVRVEVRKAEVSSAGSENLATVDKEQQLLELELDIKVMLSLEVVSITYDKLFNWLWVHSNQSSKGTSCYCDTGQILIESTCSVDHVEEALSSLIPILLSVQYFRFNPVDERCGTELDETDPAVWLRLEDAIDEYAVQK